MDRTEVIALLRQHAATLHQRCAKRSIAFFGSAAHDELRPGPARPGIDIDIDIDIAIDIHIHIDIDIHSASDSASDSDSDSASASASAILVEFDQPPILGAYFRAADSSRLPSAAQSTWSLHGA